MEDDHTEKPFKNPQKRPFSDFATAIQWSVDGEVYGMNDFFTSVCPSMLPIDNV